MKNADRSVTVQNNFTSTPAKYYDKAGNEIVVNQGKTWICTIGKEQEQWVFYE
ncbi:MAG: hypothetical protein LBV33_05065 [Lachnospiraceae bacterium]|jgi:hypothetical protein|nr:hypothetical protein [Lachnospiraceae bacterium]